MCENDRQFRTVKTFLRQGRDAITAGDEHMATYARGQLSGVNLLFAGPVSTFAGECHMALGGIAHFHVEAKRVIAAARLEQLLQMYPERG